MAVAFDSAAHGRADKLAAARVLFQEHSAPSTVAFDPTAAAAIHMEAWSFGAMRDTLTRLHTEHTDAAAAGLGTFSIALTRAFPSGCAWQ